MSPSPSRRALLVAGTFALVLSVTLVLGMSTVTADVSHMEVEATVDADIQEIEPAAEADRLAVHVEVDNPTGTTLTVRTAWLQVFDGEVVVASNAGIGFEPFVLEAGETRTVTLYTSIDRTADTEAVREAAEADELRGAGHFESSIVDRGARISIEHPSASEDADE